MLTAIDPTILEATLTRWIAVGADLPEKYRDSFDMAAETLAMKAIDGADYPSDGLLPGYPCMAFAAGFSLACTLFVASSKDPMRVDKRAVRKAIDHARNWLQHYIDQENEEGRDPLAIEKAEMQAVRERAATRDAAQKPRSRARAAAA